VLHETVVRLENDCNVGEPYLPELLLSLEGDGFVSVTFCLCLLARDLLERL